ncbi:hypothetical protein PR202_gb26933 [Eleusine coracana subsp. coracana]|uniref:Phytocyanin domain-containing protein n=1 Tax=Eleusine coracana subsp. coracana TaxID=191504 RepID=A0AAV5FTE5_ELECO|nr:hypothetical protein PR202_gb26933 [Eleusine coracana subsp. coracana]
MGTAGDRGFVAAAPQTPINPARPRTNAHPAPFLHTHARGLLPSSAAEQTTPRSDTDRSCHADRSSKSISSSSKAIKLASMASRVFGARSLGLPPLALLAAVVLSVVAAPVAASASASPPSSSLVFHVGGPRGWRVPDADTNYGWWAMNNRFHVGDDLYFKYAANDSVLLVDRAAFDACNATDPVAAFADGATTIRLDTASSAASRDTATTASASSSASWCTPPPRPRPRPDRLKVQRRREDSRAKAAVVGPGSLVGRPARRPDPPRRFLLLGSPAPRRRLPSSASSSCFSDQFAACATYVSLVRSLC